ncbi:protein ABHD11 isoform X2 [Anastrepha obliqua]|uniref:protein ABHD11 isoform X2 n=1 Tax=Anastrepha obliqua TaxID=95512 RepID=UPI0024094C0F|nr:protein ABHD11 isoform X2 [Anastrepha obliqua]
MAFKFLAKRGKAVCFYTPLNVCLFSNISGVEMSYTIYGENNRKASPLIIMHGLLGSQRNWKSVARALENKVDRMIFTVDARNHGDSPHTPEHSSAHMAVDIIKLMKNKGIAKTCLMGHSMGGRAMMHLTLKHPDLVERVIVIDISPISVPRDFDQMERIFQAMESIDIPVKHSLSQGRKIAENQIKDAVRNQATVDFILMNLKKRDNGEFHWIPNVNTLHKNLRLFDDFLSHVKNVPPFEGEVMFICGNQSNFPKELAAN